MVLKCVCASSRGRPIGLWSGRRRSRRGDNSTSKGKKSEHAAEKIASTPFGLERLS
ncbi:hypothetical protein HMPREF3036_00338 [Sutterella sp. KLE1602]|nr:hypothetical protein HMPREF3036_00338 [Sutterella sp. KLE1602]